MAITRAEGYRLQADGAKERAAVALATELLAAAWGKPEPVAHPVENRLLGDLLLPDGRYVEVKAQSIDPERYCGQNFVELCERGVREDRHWRGMEALAGLLRVTSDDLAAMTVRRRDGVREPFGRHGALSIPESLWRSDLVLYANPGPSRYVYVYFTTELARYVRSAVRSDEILLGAGACNEDTYGVLVPIPSPSCIWARDDGGRWRSLEAR